MNKLENLAQLREEKGLTQADVADTLQVSRQAVSRWETGAAAPSTQNLKRLGELYGVSLDYLLDDEQKVARPDPEPAEEKAEANGKERRFNWKALAVGTLLALGIVSAVLVYTLTREKPDEHRGVISEMVGEDISGVPTIEFDAEDW